MANFNKHLKVGAIIGIIGSAGMFLYHYSQEKDKNPNYKFSWDKFLIAVISGGALGAISGIAADKFEPALNPNHRGFFHSYTIWFLAGLTVLHVLTSNKDKILKNMVTIGFLGYSSHLALDIQTPKSLPII